VPADTLFEQILAEEVPDFEERPRRAPREEREPREHVQRHNPAEDGKARPLRDYPDISMERFRIHVGHKDGVTPREVLGAIANEAEIEGRYIGHIRIYDDYSTVDLPSGMPKEVMQILQKTHVCRKPLMIEPVTKPFATPGHYARDAAAAPKPSYEKPAYEKPAFKKEGFKKEGFKKDGFSKPAFNKDGARPEGFAKPAFKKEGYEKPAFKKDGFSKPAFNKDGAKPDGFVKPAFKKDGYEKPAFKKDGFEKPAFKKEGFKKPAFRKDGDTKPAFHNVESKDITREVLERFPDLEAPGIRKAPRPVLKANPDAVGADKPLRVKAPGAKVKPKSKRVDKDKGKRRTPIPPKAE